MDQKISAPQEADIADLAKRVLRVQQLSELHLTRQMKGDDSDLDVLQELLDTGLIKPTDTFDLQCLGIVFGRRLCTNIPGLDWAMVEDEHGRDPALRYLDSSLLLFPLTMISKRIERGEHVDVHAFLQQSRESVERLKSKVGWPA